MSRSDQQNSKGRDDGWCELGYTDKAFCDHCKYEREQKIAAVVQAARKVCKLTVPQKHSRGPRAFYQLRDALAALDESAT